MCRGGKHCVVACSHRRHGQHKTVLSCTRRWCEHNCRQDMTVVWSRPSIDEFCLISIQFPNSKFSIILGIFETEQLQIGNWVETRQNSSKLGRDQTTVMSCLQLCSHHRHVQDKTVLCYLCQWCEQCLPPRHTLLNSNYLANISDP